MQMRSQSGLVLVDKPAGPSSFAVVNRLRARYGVKAGHAGTLDPLATGLLLVLLGRATRLTRYLVGLDKRYVTEIRLGLRTSTGDGEGEVVEETPISSRREIEALTGELELPVPAASAVKIGGERAYRLHRRGVAIGMPTRRSEIHDPPVRRYAPAHRRRPLPRGGRRRGACASAAGGSRARPRATARGGRSHTNPLRARRRGSGEGARRSLGRRWRAGRGRDRQGRSPPARDRRRVRILRHPAPREHQGAAR